MACTSSQQSIQLEGSQKSLRNHHSVVTRDATTSRGVCLASTLSCVQPQTVSAGKDCILVEYTGKLTEMQHSSHV